jgi:hypothetical protein
MLSEEESQIVAALKQGAVYYFPHPSNDDPHNFILLNRNPQREDSLHFVCTQTDIDGVRRRRRNCSPPTVVVVKKESYNELKWDSVVDCNSVISETIPHLVVFLKTGRLKIKQEISPLVLSSIIAGVKMSRLTLPIVLRSM